MQCIYSIPSISSCKGLSSIFGCPPSQKVLQVLTVLRVLMQDAQHKDDTLLQAYLLPVLFRALRQAEALLFSHTITPRGYSLHETPNLMTILLRGVNVCRKSPNQKVLHLGVPRMRIGPQLAEGKCTSCPLSSSPRSSWKNNFMRMRIFSYLSTLSPSWGSSTPHGHSFLMATIIPLWSFYHKNNIYIP